MRVVGLIDSRSNKICLFLLVLVLNLFVFFASAQSPDEPKSFEQALLRAESLLYENIDHASVLFDALATAHKSPVQQERYLILEIKILAYQGKLELAQQKLFYLLENEISNDSRSVAYYLQARLYQSQQRYDKAFKYINLAVQIPQKFVSASSKIQVLLLAAELKVEELEFEQALSFTRQAVKLASLLGDNGKKCTIFESMTYIYARMEPNKEAATIGDNAIEFCEAINSEVLLVDLYAARAVIYQKNHNYQQQLLLAQKSLGLQRKTSNVINKLQVELILLDAFVGLKEWHKGSKLIQQIHLSELPINGIADQAELARLSSAILIGQGRTGAGFLEYKKYVMLETQFSAHIHSDNFNYFSRAFDNEIAKNSDKLKQLLHDKQEIVRVNDELAFLCLVLLALFLVFLAIIATLAYRSNHKVITVFDQKIDSLTNLYLYHQSFEYVMSQKRLVYNPKQRYAVLLIDINKFSVFVENFGHDEGDKLLQYLASKLKALLQEYGIILRQRDDRFVALLANCSHQRVKQLAKDSLQLLENYNLNKRHLSIGLNIGWYYSAELDVANSSELDFGLACANQALQQVISCASGIALEYKLADGAPSSKLLHYPDDHTLQIEASF